jgi:hypothetical protein
MNEEKDKNDTKENENDEKVVLKCYPDDLVAFRTKTKIKLGLIQRVGGYEDSDSDDEEENEEEELNPGDVEISCGYSYVIRNQDHVKVIDRSFCHGDVITKINDELGMSGIVIDVNMILDIKINDRIMYF